MAISLNTVTTAAQTVMSKAKPVVTTIAQKAEEIVPEIKKAGKKEYLQFFTKMFKSAGEYGKKGIDFVVKYGKMAWGAIKGAFGYLAGLFHKAPKA